MGLQRTAYFLIICVCATVILRSGQDILIPFILGALLWFIGRGLQRRMDRIGFVRRHFPRWVKLLLSVVIILLVVVGVVEVLMSNINLLVRSMAEYQPNIDKIIAELNGRLNMDVRSSLTEYSVNLEFSTLLQSLLSSISDIVGSVFMIIIYVLFLFLEEASFRPKLQAMFRPERQARIDLLRERIEHSISTYIRLKTTVSLLTGGLSYVALRFIGVDAPEFWAFLIFILNYIPTIGSLVATVFPAVFCLFQFGTFLPCLLVFGIVGTIQLVIGNFVEPRLMGSSMNVSPLVTILALSIWGAIWGITGMILSVPIVVIAIIILSQFERTQPIAIMLSEKGAINT